MRSCRSPLIHLAGPCLESLAFEPRYSQIKEPMVMQHMRSLRGLTKLELRGIHPSSYPDLICLRELGLKELRLTDCDHEAIKAILIVPGALPNLTEIVTE